MEASLVTGVDSSGVLMGFRMRFHNSGKARKRLVGFPMVLHNVHGGGMWGGEGREGSFVFVSSTLVCGSVPRS
jgi:hypothetical protein